MKPLKPYFYVYRDTQQQWRWHLRASNGEVVAASAEAYTNRWDCERAILVIRREVMPATTILASQSTPQRNSEESPDVPGA